MTVFGVSAVWLPVTDLERAVEFYTERLGLDGHRHGDNWAEVDANGLRIGLNANRSERPEGDGGAVVAFQPEGGLEQAVDELGGRGVEFAGEITEHPWGRIATFKDPDGNDLQLYEPPSS
ncbi:MAG: VOC family protein [Solirubrobacteraceae bacterium]